MMATSSTAVDYRRNAQPTVARKPFLELFKSNYQIVNANTESLKDECFKLRYKVYCEEYRFENKLSFPDKKEYDDFDQLSDHYLIQERHSDKFIGTVRLIHSVEGEMLPVETMCQHVFHDNQKPAVLAPEGYAEISRLAVLRPDLTSPKSNNPLKAELNYSLATLALCYCCVAKSFDTQHPSKYFSMMEPRLAVLLSRFGIKFTGVGGLINYRGKRAPYYWTNTCEYLSLNKEKEELLQYISEQLEIE